MKIQIIAEEIMDSKGVNLKMSELGGFRLSNRLLALHLEPQPLQFFSQYDINNSGARHSRILCYRPRQQLTMRSFCKFCLAKNYPMTQCPAVPPQLLTSLIHTREANQPSLPERSQWIQPDGHQGRSPLPFGNSALKTLHSATAANNYSLALRRCPPAKRTFA